MKLTNESIGAIMLVLQKCLLEEIDIVPMLQDLNFEPDNKLLQCTNPPVVQIDQPAVEVNQAEYASKFDPNLVS